MRPCRIKWPYIAYVARILCIYGATAAVVWAVSFAETKRDTATKAGIQVNIPSTPLLPGPPDSSYRFLPLAMLEAGGADVANATRHLGIFGEEFSKYPKSLFSKVSLEWVAFVKELYVSGDPRAATFKRWYVGNKHELHGGMIYDVRNGSNIETYMRWAVHHEFFHYIDEAIGAGRNGGAVWETLNVNAFEYSGIPAPYSTELEHPSIGLITMYSGTSVAEDRAELFAALMVDEVRPQLLKIIENDPVVRRKIRALVNFLNRVDSAMDDQYFQKRLGKLWDATMSHQKDSRK